MPRSLIASEKEALPPIERPHGRTQCPRTTACRVVEIATALCRAGSSQFGSKSDATARMQVELNFIASPTLGENGEELSMEKKTSGAEFSRSQTVHDGAQTELAWK